MTESFANRMTEQEARDWQNIPFDFTKSHNWNCARQTVNLMIYSSLIDINRRTGWQINRTTGWPAERPFEYRVLVRNCHASRDGISHLGQEAKHSHRFCGFLQVLQIKPRHIIFTSLSNHPAIWRCTLHATVSHTPSLITYPTDNYRSRFHCDPILLRLFT